MQAYPPLSPFVTGLKCRCPRCGKGPLFAGYLKVADRCLNCGLSYRFADSGDGAAWFVMLFICIFGVGSIVGIELAYAPSVYTHLALAIPLLVIVPLILLRPVKAFLINQQWLTNASEGQIKP